MSDQNDILRLHKEYQSLVRLRELCIDLAAELNGVQIPISAASILSHIRELLP